MKLILHCKQTLSLSREDILSICDPETLAEIKKHDPQPLIKAYVLASEGDTTPTIIGPDGVRGGIVRWTSAAIYQLAEKVKQGVKLFAGHTSAETMDQAAAGADRPGIAEVVGSAVIKAGKTYNVVAAWFRPEFRSAADSYDSVSVEVEYEHEETREGASRVSLVDRVLNVFGIALLRHDQVPAFKDARAIGVAYAEQYDNPERKKMSLKEASWDELKAELKSRNMHIWQIASPEDLLGIKKKQRDGSSIYVGGDKEFQKWAIELENNIREEVEAEYKPIIEDLKTKAQLADQYEKDLKKYQSVPILQKKMASLPAGLQVMLNKRIDRFSPGEDPEKAADEFIAEYRELWEAASGQADPVTGSTPQRQFSPGPSLGGSDAKDQDKTIFGVEIDDE